MRNPHPHRWRMGYSEIRDPDKERWRRPDPLLLSALLDRNNTEWAVEAEEHDQE